LALKQVFIDTSYVYALINPNDQWHARAITCQQILAAENRLLITSEFILTEIADGLSSIAFREAASRSIRLFQARQDVEIVAASASLFSNGLNLFENRPDKNWGLTDCISFTIMKEYEIFESLTADDHFRQAGFKALLLD
jgi:predicted nucleic acid-binding protein